MPHKPTPTAPATGGAYTIVQANLDGQGTRPYRRYPLSPAPAKDVGGMAVREFWPAVTDVPCPCCVVGVLVWAEAGHVPGYRICDGCGRHYLAHGDADAPGVLALRRRTRVATSTIGSAIQALLRAKGWYQAQLADELGTTDAVVSAWVTGRRRPSRARAAQLRALGCELPPPPIDRVRADIAEHTDAPRPRGRPRAPADRQPVAPLVARILAASGASQAQLAHKLGVTPAALSAWVTGTRYPTAERMAALVRMAEDPASSCATQNVASS